MKNCIGIFVLALVFSVLVAGCTKTQEPISRAGIKSIHADIKPQADGLTVEQQNVKKRLEMDNKPGSIKHLYVISAYSGQVIFYSTIKGKVTSSGKRLSPYTVATTSSDISSERGVPVDIGGRTFRTAEVLQDDGTYGTSVEYVFWFDQRGVYHQHYVSGGQIIHVSSEPIPVKSIIINIEATKEP